jgi:flotillin
VSAQKNIILFIIIGIILSTLLYIATESIQLVIFVILVTFACIMLYLKKLYTVVEANKIHVVSGGGRIRPFKDGETYTFLPLLQKRDIVTRSVIEIGVPRIKLLDTDNLPFAVEISCKVQVSDAVTAVKTLGKASPNEIIPIVDDTIQSASRSEAMKQRLPIIMRERDQIEQSIFQSTTETLARIGVTVVLFDIKNIIDDEGSSVIADMERVKSAELNRIAREAEANQNAAAEIVEATKRSEAEVNRQNALRQSETARLEQEKEVAQRKKELTLNEMDILNAETRRKAEIESERIKIQASADAEKLRTLAQGNADSELIRAQAEAEAIRVRAAADADSIRFKLEAEAEGTAKLAEALKQFNEAGIQVKIAEIDAETQKKVSESIARGLQSNSKLILPSNGVGNFFTDLATGITALKETGVTLEDVLKKTSKK